MPFTGHPVWEGLPPEVRGSMLSWSWLAYNRHTIMAEQRIANPAFAYVIEGEFPSLAGPRWRPRWPRPWSTSSTTR